MGGNYPLLVRRVHQATPQCSLCHAKEDSLIGGHLFQGRRLDSSVVITGHGYFSLTALSYII